jgi:hypothetical protein
VRTCTWILYTITCDRHVLHGVLAGVTVPQFTLYSSQLLRRTIFFICGGGAGTVYPRIRSV